MTTPPNLTIRVTAADRDVLMSAAARVGLPVTTFVRRAALAAAGRQLTPATIGVSGAAVALTDTTEVTR